jgi:hypothetical protein
LSTEVVLVGSDPQYTTLTFRLINTSRYSGECHFERQFNTRGSTLKAKVGRIGVFLFSYLIERGIVWMEVNKQVAEEILKR